MSLTTTITINATIDARLAVRIADAIRWREMDLRHRMLYGQTVDAVLDMHARFDVGHEIILPERAPERRTP